MITPQQVYNIYNLLTHSKNIFWSADNRLTFESPALTPEYIDSLCLLNDNFGLEGVEPSSTLIGKCEKFSIGEKFFICRNINHALEVVKIKTGTIEHFIYWDQTEKICLFNKIIFLKETDGNQLIIAYRQMLKLLDIISRFSDRHDPSLKYFFHFNQKDIIFDYDYPLELLSNMSLGTIDCINKMQIEFAEITGDKKRIFKQSLWLLWNGYDDPRIAFKTFVTESPRFLHRYQIEFELFASKFSFDNLKVKIDSEVKNLSFRMDECLVGMQEKIIAIPVVESLMILQMGENQLEKNIILFLISILASLLMWKLLDLQCGNLNYIKKETNDRIHELKEVPQTSQDLCCKFERLLDRIKHHFSFIRLIKMMIVTANVVTLIFVIWYTRKDYIENLLDQLANLFICECH